MRILLAAVALSFCAQAAAQYKCRNEAGRITYSGEPCAKLGLTDAGEVRDRANVAPAFKPQPQPDAAATRPPVRAEQGQAGPAAADAPAGNPERRCFKTAKGYRCNDDPEKD